MSRRVCLVKVATEKRTLGDLYKALDLIYGWDFYFPGLRDAREYKDRVLLVVILGVN